MERSLEHAKHNESLCRFLSGKSVFSDWMITVIFYTALHYVGHKLIRSHGIKNFKTHRARKNAVQSHLPEIFGEYAYLLSESQNARYHNYKKTRTLVTVANEHLKTIKNYCLH